MTILANQACGSGLQVRSTYQQCKPPASDPVRVGSRAETHSISWIRASKGVGELFIGDIGPLGLVDHKSAVSDFIQTYVGR
jgi:hypothetical protein